MDLGTFIPHLLCTVSQTSGKVEARHVVQGRKKNTDTETGIAVGGVSKAVAERRLTSKPVSS